MIDSLPFDVTYAARRLARTPLFTISAAAVLAIGIGLNAVVFNLVDTLLFRPLPFVDTDRIVHIYQDADNGVPTSTAFPAYRDMAAMTDVFSAVAATSQDTAQWDRDGAQRGISIQYATSTYMEALGLAPHLGRWFEPEHDRVGAQMLAVVSYDTWRARMGADPGVLGRTVMLNNRSVTIVGVGPESFSGDANALVTDFWVSISSAGVGGPFRVTNLDQRESHWYQVVARLAPGVTIEQVRVAMDALAAQHARDYPAIDAGRGITVFAQDDVRIHPLVDGALRGGTIVLLAIAALVLLLACSNLANLLLARGLSRGSEIALRQVLGASRLRIARLLLLEAVLLSSLGAAAGLVLAGWASTLLAAVPLPPNPFMPGGLNIEINHRVAFFGAALALATALLFGLAPALRAARGDMAASLREGGRAQSAGRGVSLLRSGLVATQVAVSVVLVIGAGLLARSLANAEGVDAGVDTDRIAVVGTNLSQAGVVPEDAAPLVDALLERIEALPGVERAALTTRLPAEPGGTTSRVVDGYTPETGTVYVELALAVVSRGYFETMGIALRQGRAFGADDSAGTRPVVVVNEAAARAYWQGGAVGGRLRGQAEDSEWLEVVGVVADTKVADLTESPTPMLYLSAEQLGVGSFSIVARTSRDPAPLTSEIERALGEVRATLPVTRSTTLEAHLGGTLGIARVLTLLMSAFSMLALSIASLGIYAVVAFAVQQRTQEFGIRAALGATSTRIVRMVVRESLTTVGIGLVIGLGLAALTMRGLVGVLYGVPPLDTFTFAGAAVLLLAASGVAAFLPARHAARANPAGLLRSE